MKALIDGDTVVYRCGFASETAPENVACMRADILIKDILEATEATEFEVWFSDTLENNYRYTIDPTYKANRKDMAKPKWYSSIKKFLTDEWDAKVTEGQEADDILGINQGENTIICANDKDLLQVPGLHYNFVRKTLLCVEPIDGLRHFYSQFLIGDKVDNIVGVYGLGVKKTENLLNHKETEAEMFQTVRHIYNDDTRLLKNGLLLWVRRQPNEFWKFPESTLSDEGGEHSDPDNRPSDG